MRRHMTAWVEYQINCYDGELKAGLIPAGEVLEFRGFQFHAKDDDEAKRRFAEIKEGEEKKGRWVRGYLCRVIHQQIVQMVK